MRFAMATILWMASAAAVLAQVSPQLAPDAIFYNGKIVTVDSSFRIAQAFAVKGDRFIAVGGNAEMKVLAGPQTQQIDLRGHAVIPGLTDSHNHQYAAAMVRYRGIDMNGISSKEDLLNRLRAAVAAAKPGQTIYASAGWDRNRIDLTRQDLDQVAPNHPVLVFKTHNTRVVNTAALRMAGVTRDTKVFALFPVAKDSSGEPHGSLNVPPQVRTVDQKLLPELTREEKKKMLLRMEQEQNAVGLTSIRDLQVPVEGMRVYTDLWRDGKMTMRVSMGLEFNVEHVDQLEHMLSPWGVGPGFGDHMLRLDGSVGEFLMIAGPPVDSSQPAAWMQEPYLNIEKFRKAVLLIDRYDWRPAFHIIENKDLDINLDAYEAADREKPIRGKRWVVEHIPDSSPDQIERMARLGIAVSAQIQSYRESAGASQRLGKQRFDWRVPMRAWIDHKLVVSTGSDWPGSPNNPFVNIEFYVSRKTIGGEVAGASQKISREEALRVATINNAYLTFEEAIKGSVEPGKLADFLILSEDIMTVPEDMIGSIYPLATYVGGRKVFSKEGF